MTLPRDYFTCGKRLVVSLRGTNTLFRHQYRIDDVDHTVCTLDVGMNDLSLIPVLAIPRVIQRYNQLFVLFNGHLKLPS
jgi:hypothetical protein